MGVCLCLLRDGVPAIEGKHSTVLTMMISGETRAWTVRSQLNFGPVFEMLRENFSAVN